MIHNFTQENHSNVSQFFAAINPDANDRVIALAQQFRGKHSRVLARIGGSGLVDSIIREHSRMASVKRSAKQQLDAVFNHMTAADIPYGETTLIDLNSANSLITSFLNALGIAVADVKAGGIDNIDRSIKYLASTGKTSGVHWNEADTTDMRAEALKAQLYALVDASNKGYEASLDSLDPDIRAVVEEARKSKDKNKEFVKICLSKEIAIGLELGELLSEPLEMDKESVKLQYDKAYKKYEGKKDEDNCVKYALYPFIQATGEGTLHDKLDELKNEWKSKNKTNPFTFTSPSHAALTGETPRAYLKDGKERHEPMWKNVSLAISAGNEKEPMKMKIPGEDTYIVLYDADNGPSLSTAEQKAIIDNELGNRYALVYKNKKGDKETKVYPIDAAQYHVDVYEGDGKYSGINKDRKHEDINGKKYKMNGVTGIDYVILNIP